ncbi:MAG: cellulase family glycosylhydrolase [Fibrobacterota bacterium]
MKYYHFGLICVVFSCTVAAMSADSLFENLHRGVNFGNALEAPDFEGQWGYEIEDHHFDSIARAGFSSVRVPVRWDTRFVRDGDSLAVEEEFFSRVDYVVDNLIEHGLYPVLNVHHYEDLFEDPRANEEDFFDLWSLIAQRYSHVSDSLVLEILNEPHGNLTPEIWNEYIGRAVDTIRKYNPDTYIMIGTAEFGGLSGLEKLELPDDDKLVVSVHYYEPFQFTHQGAEWVEGVDTDAWIGTTWEGLHPEKSTVENHVLQLVRFRREKNVPVHVGEFGAYSKAEMKYRALWTQYLGRLLEKHHIPWAYWEFGSGFGVYDPETDHWRDPLYDALLSNDTTILEKDEGNYGENILKNGDFSEGTASWTFGVWNADTGKADLTTTDSSAVITVEEATPEPWEIQLIQTDLALQADTTYVVSFTAASMTENSIDVSILEEDTFDGFGSASMDLIPTPQTFYLVFSVPEDRGPFRLVFSLGDAAGEIELSQVQVRPFLREVSGVHQSQRQDRNLILEGRTLRFDDVSRGDRIDIYTPRGTRIAEVTPVHTTGKGIYTFPRTLAPGMYVVTYGNRRRLLRLTQ